MLVAPVLCNLKILAVRLLLVGFILQLGFELSQAVVDHLQICLHGCQSKVSEPGLMLC